MRLIDADKLMRKLLINSNGQAIPEVDCDNFPINLTIKEVKDLVRNQPTAYDVDEKCTRLKLTRKNCKNTNTIFDLNEYVLLNDAIDILKGAKND